MTSSANANPTSNLETGAGAAVVETDATRTALSARDLIARLEEIRARAMPILQAAKAEYAGRAQRGYPMIVDNVARGGVFGMNLDAGFGVFFLTDGAKLFAELHTVSLRTDTLSTASAEKFGGRPAIERREIDETWTDSRFRSLISELLSLWNYQQTRIFRVDS